MIPPLTTCESLAQLIDHPLVEPELTDEQVIEGLELARRRHIASAIVRPCDIDLAVRTLQGGSVRAGAVCGFPHGSQNTATKLYEARDLLRRGAQDIDTVMNTGKLISRQFLYLETELQQMADSCHQSGATLTVNLESEHLNEELKIVACRVARRAGVDTIGTNKLDDVALLIAHSRERLKIKAYGAIPDLETAEAFRAAGCTRIELADPFPILEAWKAKLAAAQAPAADA